MSRKVLQMRPREFSRPMLALADAFVPLVVRMVNDKNIVFARPQALDNDVHLPASSVPLRDGQKGGNGVSFIMSDADVTL